MGVSAGRRFDRVVQLVSVPGLPTRAMTGQ